MFSALSNLSTKIATSKNIGSWIAGGVSVAGFSLTTASLLIGANKVASLDLMLVIASIGMVLGVGSSFVMSVKVACSK